jgi:alpha-beta hydrolase superfamily lysophospholipase
MLRRPEEDPRGVVLLLHCFTCGKDVQTMARLARNLAEFGFASLRFDLTGLGDSEGDFGQTTLSTDVADVECAARFLIERDLGPVAMLGHSAGGLATLLAAPGLDEVRAVITLNTPSTPEHLGRQLAHVEDEVRAQGRAVVKVAGRPFPLSAELFDDLERHDVEAALDALDRPLLILQCDEDSLVPLDEGKALYAAAHEPKRFVVLDGGDHLLTDQQIARNAARRVADWLDETL